MAGRIFTVDGDTGLLTIDTAALAAKSSGPSGPRYGVGYRARLQAIPGITTTGILPSKIYLPAVLGDLEISEDANHRNYDTPRAGEFSQAGGGDVGARKLRTMSLDVYVPPDDDPILPGGWTDPEDVRVLLDAILRNRTPVELLLTNAGTDEGTSFVKMYITIRNITRTSKHGEFGTLYETLTISEWRRISLTKLKAGSRSPSSTGSDLPTTRKLTATDTLASLALRYYGSPTKYAPIAQANGIKNWGQNTHLVDHSGFKLGKAVKIPERP